MYIYLQMCIYRCWHTYINTLTSNTYSIWNSHQLTTIHAYKNLHTYIDTTTVHARTHARTDSARYKHPPTHTEKYTYAHTRGKILTHIPHSKFSPLSPSLSLSLSLTLFFSPSLSLTERKEHKTHHNVFM